VYDWLGEYVERHQDSSVLDEQHRDRL
jgi:hypothetical protein